jgi:hypothetical protein
MYPGLTTLFNKRPTNYPPSISPEPDWLDNVSAVTTVPVSTERPANQRATCYPINSDVPRYNEDADDETAYVAADVFTLGTLGTLEGDILNAASFEIPTKPPVSSDVEELITNILNSADEEIEEEESVWHERTPHSRVILEVNSVDGYIDLHKRVNNLKKNDDATAP